MKEDAQLICPIAYEDTGGMWSVIEKDIISYFPLRNVTWKSLINNSQISIDKLPIRCMPSSASLFKDVDHPFRWFLAPYVYINILVCESMDSYKTNKSLLKRWIEGLNLVSRRWIILYLPMGSQTMDSYQKIYTKLSSDFYQDKSGDRTCILYVNGFQGKSGTTSIAPPNLYTELVNKIRDGVIGSFQQRCVQYDTEIRRLDALRNTAQLDFRQLFLVKESLALMYQMMQLPGESLVQYEELEALLSLAPSNSLPESEWPLIPSDLPAKKGGPSLTTISSPILKETVEMMNNMSNGATPCPPLWLCAMQQGETLLTYSINHARMKVLKSKLCMLELSQYVFARECFFLYILGKHSLCAEKGLMFITNMRSLLKHKLDMKERSSELGDLRNTVLSRAQSGKTLDGSKPSSASEGGAQNWKAELREFAVYYDIWAVISIVQIIRTCWENLLVTPNSIVAEERGKMSLETPEKITSTTKINDVQMTKIRDTAKFLTEILQFGLKILPSILPKKSVQLDNLRTVATELALKLNGWSSMATIFADNAISVKEEHDTLDQQANEEKCERVDEVAKLLQTHLIEMMVSLEKVSDNKKLMYYTEGGVSLEIKDVNVSNRSSVVAVLLMRLIAEHEEVSGRWRFACKAKVDCADTLIANGRFANALSFLKSALDPSMPLCSIHSNGHLNPPDSVLQWGHLRSVALRKQLLCSRATNDHRTYILACLNILEPSLAKFNSIDLRLLLQQDIINLSKNDVAGKPILDQLFLPTSGRFSCNVVIGETESVSANPSKLLLTKGSKIIHDETFQTKCAKCDAGDVYVIKLRLKSYFPGKIEIDSLVLTYGPFIPVGSGSFVSNLIGTFDCMPPPQSLNENGKIDVVPGEQLIPMLFNPPSIGEFVPLKLAIHVGNIIFIENFSPDINKLYSFFNAHTLVNVNPPSNVLHLQALTPRFSPVNQIDNLQIHINVHSEDTILNLALTLDSKDQIEQSDQDNTSSSRNGSQVIKTALDLSNIQDWNFYNYSTRVNSTINKESVLLGNLNGGSTLVGILPFKVTAGETLLENMNTQYNLTFRVNGMLKRNNCTMEFEAMCSCTVTAGWVVSVSQLPSVGFGKEYFCQCTVRNISSVPLQLLPFKASKLLDTEDSYGLVADNSIQELLVEPVILLPNEHFFFGLHLGFFKKTADPQKNKIKGAQAHSGGIFSKYQIAYDSYGKKINNPDSVASPDGDQTVNLKPSLQQISIMMQRAEPTQINGNHDPHVDSATHKFNESCFEHTVKILPPADSILLYRVDYHLQTSLINESNASSSFVIGRPILCKYEIKAIFPPESQHKNTQLQTKITILSSTSWITLGTATLIWQFESRKNDTCSCLVELLPLSCGPLSLPAMELSMYSDPNQASASSNKLHLSPQETVFIQSARRETLVASLKA